MAVCKKNFTMETKTCGVSCWQCKYYDKHSKKERLKEQIGQKKIEFQKQLEKDLKDFIPPENCNDGYGCKYCYDEVLAF